MSTVTKLVATARARRVAPCRYSKVERVVEGTYTTNNGFTAVVTESPRENGGAFGFVRFHNGWFPFFWHADGCQCVAYNHGFETPEGLALFTSEVIPDELRAKHAAYWMEFDARRKRLALMADED